MQRRIINLCILFLISLVSLYPFWFFLATHEKKIEINRPFTTPIEKDFNELEADNKYKDWNYFDAYLDKYNPLISFNQDNEVILEEELIMEEHDYYYIDSFNDLDQYQKILTYDKNDYSINYYGNLNDQFIFFETENPITIYYNGSIINHSVILNNNLPSTKKITLVSNQDLLINNSIIPQVKLNEGMGNNHLYLISSILNIKLASNNFFYEILNCPYVGITSKDLQYVKCNNYVLNSVI